MSTLRKYPLKQPKINRSTETGEILFEFCEGGEDMEVIKTKLEKGEPIRTKTQVFSSQYMTEEEMEDFEPQEINDITDIKNMSEYQEKIKKQNEIQED